MTMFMTTMKTTMTTTRGDGQWTYEHPKEEIKLKKGREEDKKNTLNENKNITTEVIATTTFPSTTPRRKAACV